MSENLDTQSAGVGEDTTSTTNTNTKDYSSLTGLDPKDYVSINFSTAYSLLDDWTGSVNDFTANCPKCAEDPCFMALEAAGISNGIPAQVDSFLASISQEILTVVSGCKSYFDELAKTDNNIAGLVPKKPVDDGGGGNNPEDELPYIYEDICSMYTTMSMSDLDEVLAVLEKVAKEKGITVDQLINDEKYAKDLKLALVGSDKLSEDLKKLYESGSALSTMDSLKKLIGGELKDVVGLDDTTTLTLKRYLTNIAENNNIPVDDLISDPKYSKVLKEALASMSDVGSCLSGVDESNIQSKLLSIYDGDIPENVSANAVEILRSHTDNYASNNKTTADALLSDTSNSGSLFKTANSLLRTTSYAKTLSSLSEDALKSILTSVLR